MIVAGILIVIFIIIGIFLMNGKGAFLIAGYNTMSEEEKVQYDTRALCKFMGKMMFVFASIMVLWILSAYYRLDWLLYLSIGIFIAVMLFMIIYINTSDRFKKKASE